MMSRDCCWETITFLNYVLSNFPDESWTGGVFTADERKTMLDFSFRHWKQHSPLTKGYLALTLERAGRHDDAVLVFDAVMDSAKTDQDLGTYWAPEDRAWLWYNDTTETHAFALRTLTELEPEDGRRHGLVHWLLLNKKLNHWKSTRATAEVLYSLAHYMQHEETLASREEISVAVGPRITDFVFEPDEYTGGRNRVIVAGPRHRPETMSTIVVEKDTKGFAFASATWSFSTERLPAEARGDLFSVERTYFRRFNDGERWVLRASGRRRTAGSRRPGRGPALDPGQARGRVCPPARSARRRLRARDPPLAVQVGSRDIVVRRGARLRYQLLLRVAAGRGVHLQVPTPRLDGRHLQGRPGGAAIDVRPRIHRLLGGQSAGGRYRMTFARLVEFPARCSRRLRAEKNRAAPRWRRPES